MPPATTALAFHSRPPLAWRGAPTTHVDPADPEVTHGSYGRDFGAMEAAYRRSGGIARANDVVLMLRQCSNQPLSRLARWIVARDVVSFKCHGTTWLPLFQFGGAALSVLPAVTAVIQELADVFDDWELATWFALPNSWLGGRAPVETLPDDPGEVREAARADRFVARGAG